MKMDIPKKKNGRPTKQPNAEVLVKLYEKHTASEIAEMYGVSNNTVYSWISRLRKDNKKDE